jgi:hypothetical protein
VVSEWVRNELNHQNLFKAVLAKRAPGCGYWSKASFRKYGYPPDKQEQATQLVLEQAALLSGAWAWA